MPAARSPRSGRQRAARLGAVLALAIAPAITLLGVNAPIAAASGGGEQLVQESFASGSTSPDWVLPAAPSGYNYACLTSVFDPNISPIPDCWWHPDNPGSGALQLTPPVGSAEGGVAYALSVPTAAGIDATFDTYQYGGSSADGIGFFLAAADPTGASTLQAIGQPGGFLGYAGTGGSSGMSYGYLGVGIDVYGTYESTNVDGSGCSDPLWASAAGFPDSVSVRGPGNETAGYCMLNSTVASGGLSSGTLEGGPYADRVDSQVPVEVAINPGAADVTTPSGLFVPADSYAVAFTPIGGSEQTLSGTLPTITPDLGFPDAWINPATGIPYQLAFGWVGSTGGATDTHDVNNVTVDTLDGAVPALTAALTDDAAGAPSFGATMNYDVSVANQAATADDPGPISVSDNLPAGETALADGLGQNGWGCQISGQTVSCQIDGPLASGDSLPTLVIPVAVTAPAGSTLTNTVVASSNSSNPASANDSATVAQASSSLSASATPAATSYGNTVELDASGLPAAATGTVTFTDASSATLCAATVTVAAASCSTAVLAPGSEAVSASYSGDGNYLGATASTAFTITTASPAVDVSVQDSGASAPWSGGESIGSAAAASAVVTAAGSGDTPTGTVSFSLYADGGCSGSPIATDTEALDGSGAAGSAATDPLSGGDHSYSASYSGDVNYDPADSSCAAFTVARASSSTAASVEDAATSSPWGGGEVTGASAQSSAAVTGVGGFTPTGTVTYTLYVGATCSGSPIWADSEALSAGAVPDSAATPGLAAGDLSLDAAYSGDPNYTPASSSCHAFSVAATSSATAAVVDDVTTNQAWSGGEVAGATASDAATVTGTGGVAPTGAVAYSLFAGGTCAGTAILTDAGALTGGSAPGSAPSAPLAAGDYSFAAAYSGDSSYGASASSCQRFTVRPAPVSPVVSAAAAQPTVVLSLRSAGVELRKGQVKHMHYLCEDSGGPGIASCTGTVPDGAAVDTAKTGRHTVTVTATTRDGQTVTQTVVYTVVPDNYFPVTRLKVHPNAVLGGGPGARDQAGIVAFALRLPGPGMISVRETKVDQLSGVATGKARMLYASGRLEIRHARRIVIWLRPNAGGRRLIQSHPYLLWVELAITYTPAGGNPRTRRYLVNVSAKPPVAG